MSFRPTSPPSASSPSYPSIHNSLAGPSSYALSPSGSSAAQQAQPISRSRTLFYLSVRDSSVTTTFDRRRSQARGHVQYGDTVDVADDEQEGLIGGRDGEVGLDMKGLPPKW
jgi:syntaxin 16